MPFCPVCRSEFRKEFNRCVDCDVDLVPELEPEMELTNENITQALEGKELAPIFRGTLAVAKETRQLLAEKRIASIIVDDPESLSMPGHPPRVRLLVKSDELEKAGDVLGADFRQMVEMEGIGAQYKVSYDACPACQTPLSEDMTECPDCGLFIGSV